MNKIIGPNDEYYIQNVINTRKITYSYYISAIVFSVCIGLLFYDNVGVGICISLFSPLFFSIYVNSNIEKEKQKVIIDFKDALYIISASIAAGRQMPKAIEDASNQTIFFNSKSILSKELGDISSLYTNANASISLELCRLSQKLDIQDIKTFADAYLICEENGGDVERLCLKSSTMIIKNIDFDLEVSTILSEKKLDMVILLLMPILLLYLLNISCSDYLTRLYTTLEGRIIMSISLLLMLMALLWSLKIMRLSL